MIKKSTIIVDILADHLAKKNKTQTKKAVFDGVLPDLQPWATATNELVSQMINLALTNPENFENTYGADWEEKLKEAFTFQSTLEESPHGAELAPIN